MTQELIDLAVKLFPLFQKLLALRHDRPYTEEELRAELTKEADALSQKIDEDLKAHPI